MAAEVFTRDQRERLFSRLVFEGSCLVYTGGRNEKGYGRIRFGKRDLYAHRVAAAIKLGREIEEGEVVMHVCDNPACCLPAHLLIGTIEANNKDRAAKGRSGKATKRMPPMDPATVVQVRIWLKLGQGVCSIARRLGRGEKSIRDVRDFVTFKNVRESQTSLFEPVVRA